ncbi:KilA domain-containing protein [Azospirillum brasilense]|uniref:KilA domain-containing protein n=1 Tax=Azospirillum brasilense TaxID=192 RepID=A0A560BMX9_AZOBR|nr:KilA-N domain-containing protein [Azospirillum brasilense]TWA73977.1 KilA domain-containing protein [Azospirillum brasilense]
MTNITRTFNGTPIGQRDDGYLNATAMCKANGKEWKHYNENAGTADFIAELSRSVGIPADLLVATVTTGPNAGRGTWVHPQVAYHLAQWCSPAFAVQVTEWIHDIRTKGYAALPGADIAATVAGIVAPLIARMESTDHQVATLSQQVQDLIVTADNRNSAVAGVTVLELLDAAGAVQKGRRSLGGKIRHELLEIAAAQTPPLALSRHSHSNVWIFPVEFAQAYMRRRGRLLVELHNSELEGGETLTLPLLGLGRRGRKG